MASFNFPPPPIRGEAGDFVWTSWQNTLYKSLASPGAIVWTTVDKAGSSIADLANHDHALLTNKLGTGEYHISAAEAAKVTALPAVATIITTGNYASNNLVDTSFKTKTGIPTTSDISAGKWAIYKDTSGGSLKLYANDAGTIKSVALV